MNEERNKTVITVTGTYPWWLATDIVCIGGDGKMFEVMTIRDPKKELPFIQILDLDKQRKQCGLIFIYYNSVK